MSVLRKRSPWVLPVASLFVGALTLGLAGCGGGGDDSGFPTPPATTGPITIPAGSQPTAINATNPTPVFAGQAATVTSGNVNNPGESNGVTSVTVTIPAGILQGNDTLAVQVLPSGQSVINRVRVTNPNSVQGISTTTTLAYGPVSNGQVDLNRPIVFAGADGVPDIRIQIQSGELNDLVSKLNSGNYVLRVRKYNPTTGQSVIATDCIATVDAANQSVNLDGNCSGLIDVTLETVQHNQGGVG